MFRTALIASTSLATLLSSVLAAEEGDWIVRGRAIIVSPQEDAS